MERTDEVLRVGELEVRPADYVARAGARTLFLSLRELELLTVLARRAGCVVTREELHESVWGRPRGRNDRCVDVYVSKLRAKLARALPDRTYIHTHFGLGYRLESEPSRPFHKSLTTR